MSGSLLFPSGLLEIFVRSLCRSARPTDDFQQMMCIYVHQLASTSSSVRDEAQQLCALDVLT